ncbi:MAG: anaerobic sulfatase maturase [Halanaerobiales bacterium]
MKKTKNSSSELKDKSKRNRETTQNKFPFSIMVFPAGPVCNLNCEYCYYLDKTEYYQGNSGFQMTEELLEEYIAQYIEAQPGPYVNFGWQGGEPTLRGLDFFRKAVEIQQKYLPAEWQCQNSLQTNATLLDDEWCQFFSDNNFLIGVSLDGPAALHDHYRKNKKGEATYQDVISGIELMKKYNVDFNILCVINDINSDHPVEVYNHFKEIGTNYIQLIPIVEVMNDKGNVSTRSVEPGKYGRFLISVFDQWVRNDLGEVYIQIFEEAVTAWSGYRPNLCVFSETCGNAEVMEHNGDIYSCDHFVFPEYKLGNLLDQPLLEMIQSAKQKKFGQDKLDTLADKCRHCEVNFICHGGCPKNRIVPINNDDKKLNYLCEAYKMFFNYIDPFMKEIVNSLKKRQSPVLIKDKMVEVYDRVWDIGRNAPCPCGSGKKYKKCCIDR